MPRHKLSRRDASVVNALRKVTRGHRPRIRHIEFTREDRSAPVSIVRIATVTGTPLYGDGQVLARSNGTLHVKRIARILERLPRHTRAAVLSGRTARGTVLILRLR